MRQYESWPYSRKATTQPVQDSGLHLGGGCAHNFLRALSYLKPFLPNFVGSITPNKAISPNLIILLTPTFSLQRRSVYEQLKGESHRCFTGPHFTGVYLAGHLLYLNTLYVKD